MNIVLMLEDDHRRVEELFQRYNDGDHSVVSDLRAELGIHTQIEEQILYPEIETVVPGGPEMVAHAKEEHQRVDTLLMKLSQFPDDTILPGDLEKLVGDHVAEEEGEVFPALEDHCSEERLEELGAEADRLKSEHG
jgi:hemerythrin superfamily protein